MIDAFELKDLPNIEVLSRSQDKREEESEKARWTRTTAVSSSKQGHKGNIH